MKLLGKKITPTVFMILAVFLLALAPSQAFADTTFEDIKKGMDNAADTFSTTLPFYSTLGLNTPDAYIGQLLRVPPNITVGASAGAVFIPVSELEGFLDKLDVSVPSELDTLGLPMPAALLDARFGGFVYPFDFGVKVGYLPKLDVFGKDVSFDSLLVGADIRTPVFRGPGPIPTISVGAGVNYLSGSLSFPIDEVTAEGTTFDDATFNADWSATVFDLKAQGSSNLLIFTPYAGLGASFAMANTDFEVDGDLAGDNQDAIDAAKDAGLELDDSIKSSSDETGWGVRAFGGTSINMAMLRLDLGLSYNVIGKNLGANIGARIQL